MMIHLVRMRVGFFKNQAKGLYDRYLDVCFLLALLFAPALIQAPALIAYPLLVFFEHPFDTGRNLAPLLAWLGLAVVWARIHRQFIVGGPLAGFVRSLSISGLQLRLVDIAMLVLGMAVFIVPITVAAWTALDAERSAGVDGRFWLYLSLLVLLPLSLARNVVYGGIRRDWIVPLLALLVLLSPPGPISVVRHGLVLFALSAALAANIYRIRHEPQHTGYPYLAWLEQLAACPPLIFLMNNFRRFLTTRWHDSASRILWAILPLAFSWWMIYIVGKDHDAPMFVHFALGCFIGILSGSYRVLFDGRAVLTAYARSINRGEQTLAIADHIVMITLASLVLLPWLTLFSMKTTLFSDMYLINLFAFYTSLLVLLGSTRVQMHKRTVIVRFAIAALGMFLAGTLL